MEGAESGVNMLHPTDEDILLGDTINSITEAWEGSLEESPERLIVLDLEASFWRNVVDLVKRYI